MNFSDPIADMLTRIRNGITARHDSVLIPASKPKVAIAKLLKDEGFVKDYSVVKGKPERMIKVQLKYIDKTPVLSGLERVSKPGLRVYVAKDEISRVYGGMGISLISTSQGIMTGRQAWQKGLGGELLCNIW
jgi:small subunit ribosomal protein S8